MLHCNHIYLLIMFFDISGLQKLQRQSQKRKSPRQINRNKPKNHRNQVVHRRLRVSQSKMTFCRVCWSLRHSRSRRLEGFVLICFILAYFGLFCFFYFPLEPSGWEKKDTKSPPGPCSYTNATWNVHFIIIVKKTNKQKQENKNCGWRRKIIK